MSNVFETHGLTKRYGTKAVLRDVGVSVGAGHCVALLGHNGAGKTTLLKILLGLTVPSEGHVSLLGRDPRGHDADEVRRAVGYLPESVTFPPGMSGRELMCFYARLKRVDLAQCDTLLDKVDLTAAARNRVKTYSKGMRQRLGLAQALLGHPRLLFLDEPTNGLDPPLRRQFYDIIRSLTGAGSTAVVSSHMLTEIEARADLIAILCDGALAAFGTLDELRTSSHLPYRLRLQVQVDSVGAIAEAIGRDFALDRVDGGVMDFVCPMPDKMAIVRRVAALNGVVRDVDILPPRLEDIYAHFVDERRSR